MSSHDPWSRYRQHTFLIVGLSDRTGVHAGRLFDKHGVRYRISDSAPRDVIAPKLCDLGVDPEDVFCGPQTPDQLDGVSRVLISPGIPRDIPLIAEAARRNIPVLGDVDFAYEFISHKHIVAITGTDGKTTTTSLTGSLLEEVGPVVVAGNIGVSPLALMEPILSSRWLVLELSSFMLEQLTQFRANIAALLNVAQDHVDRYATLSEYANTKFAIVQHARTTDLLVKNIDNPVVASFCPSHLRVQEVSAKKRSGSIYFAEGCFHAPGIRIPYDECHLGGKQNIINVLTAMAIAAEAGVDPAKMVDRIRSFKGVRHRMQFVGRFRGVEVYDDSKASNVHAVTAALSNFDGNVVLILGGRDKGLDFANITEHKHRIRALVCYGEDGKRIRDYLGLHPALYTYAFEEAVALAVGQCHSGDVLLLSPGCTSWDQYPNYEVRGDVFQQLIPQLFRDDRRCP